MIGLVLVSAVIAASWEPMEVEATAYCPCPYCCGHRAAGVTANGTKVRDEPYGMAADPRMLPYGTSVWVPVGSGYLDRQKPDDEHRIFTVDDTGGAIIRETRSGPVPRVDLRFIHHSSAKRFGRKRITIYVWR